MKKEDAIPADPVSDQASFPPFFRLFHRARVYYRVDRGPEKINGSSAARMIAAEINRRGGDVKVPAGDIYAIGLIDRVLREVAARYRRRTAPGFLAAAADYIQDRLGSGRLEAAETGLLKTIPPFHRIITPEASPEEYPSLSSGGIPNNQILLEELVMTYLSSGNPAFSPLRPLFEDRPLKEETCYLRLIDEFRSFCRESPCPPGTGYDLFSLLEAPSRQQPHSLAGQLAFIREQWGDMLGAHLREELLTGEDLIAEDEKIHATGPGPIQGPGLAGGFGEGIGATGLIPEFYERFTPDLDWMPRVVLMVKNSHVWLDQLSKRYRRPITRLDAIPDEELDRLARWGFSGLWLIGIWERSRASRQIKRRCGNPEADASAYSLYDYTIARDLGGARALENLKYRAWQRGIRLASDMVPNHMGIDSRWIREHPDWFIHSSHPPFPGYRFTGPDLSSDPAVGIYLEDGYWDRRDAAVSFKRVDRESGKISYIYHGNDGTSMPWNDTAQLDFLRADVREAIIQAILRVAKKFPIIRFDAAMVLVKKHFQRLWYPPPGKGGAIPSRAGRGVSAEEFNRLFPLEFWREVVDRVAEEAPETLLLAEAFWLLEGYFVRTLGMHRVYNSAFMNMLKMEMNADYRRVVKEVLSFDPRILERFVNFMNNPDEATAVAQFGKGDKYFGVCTLLVTMPGLPLFGHGQVEGLVEKYGMEYRRAYWDEPVDEYLVSRHREEIFPLMKKRHLFSGVENFNLYDFFLEEGGVDENVFAYSNRYENERSLIVYNNRYRDTAGWIRLSAPRVKSEGGGNGTAVSSSIARGLGLRAEAGDYCIFRDLRTGLEYIRSSRKIEDRGFHILLGAYQCHVFYNFREIKDDEQGFLAALESSLGGGGTENISRDLKKVSFAGLFRPFSRLLNPPSVRRLFSLPAKVPGGVKLDNEITAALASDLENFIREACRLRGRRKADTALSAGDLTLIETIVRLATPDRRLCWISSRYSRPALKNLFSRIPPGPDPSLSVYRVFYAWSLLEAMGRRITSAKKGEDPSVWLKKWFLEDSIGNFFRQLGVGADRVKSELFLIAVLLRHQGRLKKIKTKNHLYLLEPVFRDSAVRSFLLYHWHNDILWFNRERFHELLYWLTASAALVKTAGIRKEKNKLRIRGMVLFRAARKLAELAEESGYRVRDFRRLLAEEPRGGRKTKGGGTPIKASGRGERTPIKASGRGERTKGPRLKRRGGARGRKDPD